MNRKGDVGDQINVFGFLFLILIIGVGIVIGVLIFFGKGYDFREGEAKLLNYKIKECLLKNELNKEFFLGFFQKCKLDKDVIEKNNIIRICENSEDCVFEDNKEKVLIFVGSNFRACKFEGVRGNENFPKCSIQSLEKAGKKYEIITGSSQISRRLQG